MFPSREKALQAAQRLANETDLVHYVLSHPEWPPHVHEVTSAEEIAGTDLSEFVITVVHPEVSIENIIVDLYDKIEDLMVRVAKLEAWRMSNTIT